MLLGQRQGYETKVSASRRRLRLHPGWISPGGGVLGGLLLAAYLAARPDAPPMPEARKALLPFPTVAASDNAYLRYQAAGRRVSWPGGATASEALRGDPAGTGEAWRRAVAANGEALAELRRATQASAFAAGDASAAKRGETPTFESLTPLMRLADADLRQALADAQWERAIARTRDLVVMGRRLLYAPYARAVGEMQGAGLLRRTALAWQEFKGWEAVPEDALATLDAELEQAELWRGRRQDMLLGEREAVLQPLTHWRFSTGWRGGAEHWLAEPIAPYLAGVVDAQREALASGDLVALRALEARYLDHGRLSLGLLFVSRPRLALARWYAGTAVGSAHRLLVALALAESDVLGLRLEAVAQAHRRRTGREPRSLAEFGFLGHAADPFRPARNLRMQDGRVYSPAWDAADEGLRHPLTLKELREGAQGDWVLWEAKR